MTLLKEHTILTTKNKRSLPLPGPDQLMELVLKRIRLRARKRIMWLRKTWIDTNQHKHEVDGFDYHTEVDGYLYDQDNPQTEAGWLNGNELTIETDKELKRVEKILANDKVSRLALVIRIFRLNDQEVDIIQACLALTLEPNINRVYAYLQDHNARNYVTEELVARLFAHGRYLNLGANSPLKVWGLVSITEMRGEPAKITLDPFIKNWLLGVNDLDEALVACAIIPPVMEALPGWPVEEAINYATRFLNKEQGPCLRILADGASGSGRTSFSAFVSRNLGLEALYIDSDKIHEQSLSSIFMKAQRFAFLNNCALIWNGSAIKTIAWPGHIHCFRLQFVCVEQEEFLPVTDKIIDHRIKLPGLSLEQKKKYWLQLLPSAKKWRGKELDSILRRYEINIGDIAAIADRKVESPAEASNFFRILSRGKLGNLAQLMSSAYKWDDLIVPAWLTQLLQDFTFEAIERKAIWELPEVARLFPQGRGLTALFTGSPGTGKTMAAQVIANYLKLDLYRVDLSTVVSKYVGETSKNIERILSKAEHMDLLLLFDEADALFGKRTEVKDAHDRFANTDTNYLLQAIEQYPGIVILTSNKKSNIDTGFIRRLRFAIEFPKPDGEYRLKLWQRMLMEIAGEANSPVAESELKKLADSIELTGSQIKFSVLTGLFLARREGENISLPHLFNGIERELMKEGRSPGKEIKQAFK